MAGRFVIQKFAASNSRSRILLWAHAGSVRAGARCTGTPQEVGSRILSHLFHGSAIQPGSVVPNKFGIHGGAARNSGIFPCSSFAAKTSCLSACKPSIVINSMKPAFTYPVRGANQTFSSTVSTGHKISTRAETPASQTQWDALDAKLAVKNSDFNKFMRTQKLLCGFACFAFIFGIFLEEVAHHIRNSNGNNQNVPQSR